MASGSAAAMLDTWDSSFLRKVVAQDAESTISTKSAHFTLVVYKSMEIRIISVNYEGHKKKKNRKQ